MGLGPSTCSRGRPLLIRSVVRNELSGESDLPPAPSGLGGTHLRHRNDVKGWDLDVGDLDEDGDLDIALVRAAGPSELYVNQGGMQSCLVDSTIIIGAAEQQPHQLVEGDDVFMVQWLTPLRATRGLGAAARRCGAGAVGGPVEWRPAMG